MLLRSTAPIVNKYSLHRKKENFLNQNSLGPASIKENFNREKKDKENPFLCFYHTARIPSPLPLRVAKTGRNNLNEEFTSLLPTGIGERF
jgi:hypothetical protein